MNELTRQRICFWLFFLTCYVIAWNMQPQLLLKGDVVWQMHMARLVLAGGNYVRDFFEINPPLSIYLYMPAVLLQKIFPFSNTVAVRIYMFGMASASILLCNWLARRIFSTQDYMIRYSFLLALAFVYLIMPVSEFGQRECMLLYLVMPYFLLTAIRLEQQSIPNGAAALIGIFAGIGFGLKPFFLATVLLIELYYLIFLIRNKKSLKLWLRPELLGIVGFLLLYLVMIFLRHPAYITTVVPIASRFYYQYYSYSLSQLIIHPVILFVVLAPFAFILPLFKNPYKQFTNILLIALVGFFSAYIMQRIAWYYHLLPVLSIAFILYFFMVSMLLQENKNELKNLLFAIALSVMILAYPIYFVANSYSSMAKQNTAMQPIIQYLQMHESGQPIYFFSSDTAYMVSVLERGNTLPASRLQFLTWMRRDFNTEAKPRNAQDKKDELFFIKMLTEDLMKYKPKLIYVDMTPFFNKNKTKPDYLTILLQNPEFKQAWKKYRYMRTEWNLFYYKFDVYERVD